MKKKKTNESERKKKVRIAYERFEQRSETSARQLKFTFSHCSIYNLLINSASSARSVIMNFPLHLLAGDFPFVIINSTLSLRLFQRTGMPLNCDNVLRIRREQINREQIELSS